MKEIDAVILNRQDYDNLKKIESDFNNLVEVKAKELYKKNKDNIVIQISFNRYPELGDKSFLETSHGMYEEDVLKYLNGIEDTIHKWAENILKKEFEEYKLMRKTARHCTRYAERIYKLTRNLQLYKYGLMVMGLFTILLILIK